MSGLVSLVGAGPGDPELLTLRGARRLAEADLVLHDALVVSEMLDLAPRAQRFFVGKRAGRPGLAQEEINSIMIRRARRGSRIVRLKCGDPFVFGRGGEEALALAAAGVAVEIVPGVSAALAAPALAGIPLTQRGVSSAFAVVSGHAPRAYSTLFACLEPHSATLVVLMGLQQRREIAGRLMARGWGGETPAAILLGASTRRSAVWSGSLARMGAAPLTERALGAPATIVIGDVVALRGEAVGPVAASSRAGGWKGERLYVGAR